MRPGAPDNNGMWIPERGLGDTDGISVTVTADASGYSKIRTDTAGYSGIQPDTVDLLQNS